MFSAFYRHLANTPELTPLLEHLPPIINDWARKAQRENHKNPLRLLQHLPEMSTPTAPTIDLGDTVSFGDSSNLTTAEHKRLEQFLLQMKPWRKGPYRLCDVFIDTEWRSDWKWQRVAPHIRDLSQRHVLDVGCGSGYHLWRMREAGAASAIGIDPFDLFVFQFMAVHHFNPDAAVHCLPLGIDDMPATPVFDTVFSMGVLYHRKSPIDFLNQLRQLLQPEGELVLETLVVPGDQHTVLVPQDRYARMRNVWFLPSVEALTRWLERVGYEDVRCVDLNVTRLEEQRRTRWMDFESLAECLDPQNPELTVEGYPAPLRATLIAQRGRKP